MRKVQISINHHLRELAPKLELGVLTASVRVSDSPSELGEVLSRAASHACAFSGAVENLPQISALREVYRKLGNDPSRYRGSAESLVRRILRGKGIYKINTVVDINNIVSLESLHSVGAYDMQRIESPLCFRVGSTGEQYKGIGKDVINLAKLPVFCDASGPFGSATSDSERSMITLDTKDIILIVIAFDGGAETALVRASELLERFSEGRNIESTLL